VPDRTMPPEQATSQMPSTCVDFDARLLDEPWPVRPVSELNWRAPFTPILTCTGIGPSRIR